MIVTRPHGFITSTRLRNIGGVKRRVLRWIPNKMMKTQVVTNIVQSIKTNRAPTLLKVHMREMLNYLQIYTGMISSYGKQQRTFTHNSHCFNFGLSFTSAHKWWYKLTVTWKRYTFHSIAELSTSKYQELGNVSKNLEINPNPYWDPNLKSDSKSCLDVSWLILGYGTA